MNEGVDTSRYPSRAEIRAWANARQPGITADRGHMPRFVVLAWDKAHPDRPYVASQGFHGQPDGYMHHGCRCDRCLTAGRRYSLARYHLRKDEVDEARADELLGGDPS